MTFALDNPFVALMTLDHELHILELNQMGTEFLESTGTNITKGRLLTEFLTGCDFKKWQELIHQSLSSGLTFELKVKTNKKKLVHFRFFAQKPSNTNQDTPETILLFFVKIEPPPQLALQLELQMMEIALERKAYELSLFRNLLHQIKRIQNYDDVIYTLMRFICEHFLLGHGFFIKVFTDSTLRAHVSSNFSLQGTPNLDGLRQRVCLLTDNPPEYLLATQKYWKYEIPEVFHRLFKIDGLELTGVLHLPIKFGDNLLGVLQLGHYAPHHGLSDEDIDIIGLLLEQIDPFIESAKLFEMSMVDDLTGVFNKRYFKLTAEREFLKWKSNPEHSMSLILLDIDHFKKVNDTYGHVAGDRALMALGKILTGSSRSHDFICRYGGEEFAILLMEPASVAQMLTERLMKELHSTTIELGPEIQYKMTASFGISQIHPSLVNLEAWIESADRALYEAKRTGRDRFVIAVNPKPVS
jgi:diguanylate cyclase (GGDEF)-like protein